ncbi:UNVERIFIED_CONTAM: hypothetical protein FKN15_015825 [Acipenser sinensis]
MQLWASPLAPGQTTGVAGVRKIFREYSFPSLNDRSMQELGYKWCTFRSSNSKLQAKENSLASPVRNRGGYDTETKVFGTALSKQTVFKTEPVDLQQESQSSEDTPTNDNPAKTPITSRRYKDIPKSKAECIGQVYTTFLSGLPAAKESDEPIQQKQKEEQNQQCDALNPVHNPSVSSEEAVSLVHTGDKTEAAEQNVPLDSTSGLARGSQQQKPSLTLPVSPGSLQQRELFNLPAVPVLHSRGNSSTYLQFQFSTAEGTLQLTCSSSSPQQRELFNLPAVPVLHSRGNSSTYLQFQFSD